MLAVEQILAGRIRALAVVVVRVQLEALDRHTKVEMVDQDCHLQLQERLLL